MNAHFTEARSLLSIAAARAACVTAGADLTTSWYVAQVGLGVRGKQLTRLLRLRPSTVRAVVRTFEEARERADVDATLDGIERRAHAWAA